MNNLLSTRIKRLEKVTPTGYPVCVWCNEGDDAVVIRAEAERANPTRQILLVGWQKATQR